MAVDVLIVEDDEDVRSVIEDVLRSEKVDFVSCPNGMEALSWLLRAEALPRLILLDIEMPVMNGTQFLIALKGRGSLAGIPVVVLTAALELPGNVADVRLLPKPFCVRSLAEVVHSLLGRDEKP